MQLPSALGMCELSFSRLKYSIELLIEYSTDTINYRVAQNKPTSGPSFKLVIQQRFEASHAEMLQKLLSSEVATCKIQI